LNKNSNRSNSPHREELIKLLSDNPKDLKSRVALAKTYFEDGYYEFSLRELRDIHTDSAEVASLIMKIKTYLGDFSKEGDSRHTTGANKTLAEIEI